jgi:hypothetical protein
MADEVSALGGISDKRTPETSLLDHLGRIAHNRAGRLAVQLHLSKFKPQNRRPHHIRIASRSFDSVLNSADAQIYVLSNGDIVLLSKNVKVEDIEAVIAKIRALFRMDPLAVRGRLADGTQFATWYDFDKDFESFVEMVRGLDVQQRRTRPRRGEDASAGQGQDGGYGGLALDPNSLATIDEQIQKLRLGDMIREQAAVIIGLDGTEKILFQEKYLSIGDLQKQIGGQYSLLSNAWLFQHLTETIDRRVLAALARDDFTNMPYDISVNLNVKTVMSRDFQRFDEAVNDATQRIVIELQQIDVFSNVNLYGQARDWLRDRGYRVLIDGLNPLSLQYFNPGLLDADLYKVAWGTLFTETESAAEHAEIQALVGEIGPDRFILARTDTESAIRWALTLGIRRFQGFFIDLLVRKQMEKRGQIPSDSPGVRR